MKKQLGRFEITEPIQPGANGMVYRAVEQLSPGITRPAAIKILKGFAVEGQAQQHALRKETELLISLGSCPNIVSVYGCGVDDEVGPWIAMELAGQSLRHYIRDEPAEPDQVRILLANALRALAVLHGIDPPVIHRDLKPTNILRDQLGAWKLTDFGLAKRGDSDDTLDVMTVQYAAPEMLDGRLGPESPRADLYSLGMIAYEFALGRTLYRKQFPSVFDPHAEPDASPSDTRSKWMYWHTSPQMTLPPPGKVIDGYPAPLSDLMAALTAKPLDARLGSAEEALARLGELPARVPAIERRDDKLEWIREQMNPRTVALAALTGVLLVAFLGVAFVRLSAKPEILLAGDGHFSSESPEVTIRGEITDFPRKGSATVLLHGGDRFDVTLDDDGNFTSKVTLPSLGDAPALVKVTDRSGNEVARRIARLDRRAPDRVEIAIKTSPAVQGAEVVYRVAGRAVIHATTGEDGTAKAEVPYGSFVLTVTHPRFWSLSRALESGIDPVRSFRANLQPLPPAELDAKGDKILDEMDHIADQIVSGDHTAAERFAGLRKEYARLQPSASEGGRDADPYADLRDTLPEKLAGLVTELRGGDPTKLKEFKSVTEHLRTLPVPPSPEDGKGTARAAESLEPIDPLTVAQLSLDQLEAFAKEQVPRGSLSVESLPQQGKLRIHGVVFNEAELARMGNRLAPAASRLLFDVEIAPDALCRRMERALLRAGALDVRVDVLSAAGDQALFVHFNPSVDASVSEVIGVARDYVLDDDLLFVQQLTPRLVVHPGRLGSAVPAD